MSSLSEAKDLPVIQQSPSAPLPRRAGPRSGTHGGARDWGGATPIPPPRRSRQATTHIFVVPHPHTSSFPISVPRLPRLRSGTMVDGRRNGATPSLPPHPISPPDSLLVSSSSEAKDLPVIPQPHSPLAQPAFSQPVVPSIVSPHSDAGPVPTVGRWTGAATPFTPSTQSQPPHSPHTPVGAGFKRVFQKSRG